MSTTKNIVIEEDDKNNITILEDVQVTEQFSDTLPIGSEIEDEKYNTPDET